MFGEATFGQVTFSRIIGTSAPRTPFELLIENPVAARMFLVEMAPYDFIGSPEGIENFYFADQGFVTGASDSPAQKNFESNSGTAVVLYAHNDQRTHRRDRAIYRRIGIKKHRCAVRHLAR